MDIKPTVEMKETSEKLGLDEEKLASPTFSNADESGSRNLEWIDPVAEKKLLRKLDLHVIPPLFLLFLLAFLDRVNIGWSPFPPLPLAEVVMCSDSLSGI